MFENLRKLPNQITLIRICLIPIMWFLVLKDYPLYYIGILLIICGITDILDGYLARKLNQMTEFGSRLDSWGDNILLISTILWTAIRMPEVFTENFLLMFTALGFYGLYLFLGAVKFHRFGNLHLYLSKAASFFAYIFLLHAFLTGNYSRGLFIFTAILSILSTIEGILIEFFSSHVDEHMGSIFLLYIKGEITFIDKVKRYFKKR